MAIKKLYTLWYDNPGHSMRQIKKQLLTHEMAIKLSTPNGMIILAIPCDLKKLNINT